VIQPADNAAFMILAAFDAEMAALFVTVTCEAVRSNFEFSSRFLRLEFDFRRADCDVVSRPLIVEVSNNGQRNDEPADNSCCDRFHQTYSSLSFSIASPRRAFRPPHALKNMAGGCQSISF